MRRGSDVVFRESNSVIVFWRPHMYKSARAMIRTAAPAMEIPAMAAGESTGAVEYVFAVCKVSEVADGVIVVVVVPVGAREVVAGEGTISLGKYSPGENIRLEFLAKASWVSNVSVSFGFMTPTMPSSMQAPGAEQ